MAIKGFEKAKKSEARRLIMNVEGTEKTGKTTFALSAPSPIALFNLDVGTEGVVDQYLKEKSIWISTTNYRDTTDPNEWVKMWEKMKAAWYAALGADLKDCRTLIMDTGTEMWELARLARFGKLTQVLPHHYGPVNAEFRDLIRKSYDCDKNLILIHKQKDEYINDKATGRMKRAGFGDVGHLVQMNVVASWSKDDGFKITVRDCRFDMALAGMEFMNEQANFDTLAGMIWSDWE